jgi:hypothetical protein
MQPFQNTTITSDFVSQAESSEKTWVWVPDDIEGYLSGWVKSDKDDIVEVVLDGGRGVCCSSCRFPQLLTFGIRSDDCQDTVCPRKIRPSSIEWTISPTFLF